MLFQKETPMLFQKETPMRAMTLFVLFSLALAAFVMVAETRSGAAPEVKLPVLDLTRTAVVVTDPQNDFLSPTGATGKLVGKSVEQTGRFRT